jgi:arylsulfate sulfotransferase
VTFKFHSRIILVLLVTLVAACQLTRPAEVLKFEITLNPEGRTPLAAEAEVELSRPCRVDSIIINGAQTPLNLTEINEKHRVPILGLKPENEAKVQLQFVDETGQTFTTPEQSIKTAPLPPDFPTLKVVKSQAERDHRYQLFYASQWKTVDDIPKQGYLIVTNSDTEVVWYQHFETLMNEIRLNEKGHLVILDLWHLRITEQDLLGRVVRSYQANDLKPSDEGGIPVATETFHHDFVQDSSKDLLWTLGTKIQGDSLDDLLLSIDANGQIQSSLSFMDMLDAKRRIYRPDRSLWENFYEQKHYDWGHANSLVFDESMQRALVSLRHQDAVVEFQVESGQVEWILAPPEGWSEPYRKYLLKPQGEFEWPRRQHAAKWSRRGTLLLFDNGHEESRAVEFEIDRKAKTVRQVWEFRGEEPFRSRFLCDVDEVPDSGNIIVTDGGRQTEESQYWARILEVTHDEKPQIVHEFHVTWPQGQGCTIYRSDQFSSFYSAASR